MQKYLKFEYFYIILILVWVPLNLFILKFDAAGRTISLLTFFLFFILILKKNFIRIAFRKPLIIWGLWVVYASINSLIIGYGEEKPVFSLFTLLFVPYFFMVLINILAIRDYKRLLNVLILGMYLSIIIILLFNNNSSNDDRYGGEMNSNTVGIMSVVLLMLIYLKYLHKSISLIFLIIMSVIPVILIIKTGSKTAFGGLLMLIFAHVIVHRSKNIIITISRFIIGLVLLYFPLNFVLQNSTLGERILESTEQAEKLEIDTGNTFLDKFGDRGLYYYFGWQAFKENPISGIGISNFKTYTESKYSLHTEYMIQLAELGIIGFLLFVFFYISIFKKLFELKKSSNNNKNIEIYIYYLIIILIMITATRMYRVWYLFTIIGVVTGYISKENFSKKKLSIIAREVTKKLKHY